MPRRACRWAAPNQDGCSPVHERGRPQSRAAAPRRWAARAGAGPHPGRRQPAAGDDLQRWPVRQLAPTAPGTAPVSQSGGLRRANGQLRHYSGHKADAVGVGFPAGQEIANDIDIPWQRQSRPRPAAMSSPHTLRLPASGNPHPPPRRTRLRPALAVGRSAFRYARRISRTVAQYAGSGCPCRAGSRFSFSRRRLPAGPTTRSDPQPPAPSPDAPDPPPAQSAASL